MGQGTFVAICGSGKKQIYPSSPASGPLHLLFPQLEILCHFLPMASHDRSSGCVTIQQTLPTPWDGGRTQGPHPAKHVLGDFFQMTGLLSGPSHTLVN